MQSRKESNLKNVVVVGASGAGASLARDLAKKLPSDHRIVLIDANEFAYYAIAGLRAAVVPGWENKIFKPLDSFFGPAHQTRHIVLTKTKVIKLSERSLWVDVENESKGFGTEIAFDYCVLALGSIYGAPMRSLSGSIEEGKDHLRGLQDQIKAARQIVLIGGGSVGIEFAGEIASQYPKEKSVTIVHRNPQLLSKSVPAKLAAKLHWQLEAAGIHVVLGTEVDSNIVESGRGRVDLGGGKIIDADLIFNTTGTKTNTSLIAAADANVLDPNGLVKVDAHLRIVPSLDGGFFDGKTYFAIGDCAASLGPQTYFKAKNDATFAAKNILASIFKKSLTAIKAPLDVIVVPIGTTGGAGKVPFGIVGAWPTSLIKGKGLFISNFNSLYLYSASTIVSTIMPILAVTVVITAWWSYHHVGLGRAT